MNGRKAHRMGTLVFSLAMVVIGVALIVQAFLAQGGVSSSRLLLGVLFMAAGCGRGWVERRRSGGAS